jgi:GNAT superfamily N-acetyltransferase
MYGQPLFSSETLATEIAWYVNKDHRTSTAAFRLMKAYEEWALSKGVKYVGMTYLEDITDLSEIYEKKGYSKAETHHIKEF